MVSRSPYKGSNNNSLNSSGRSRKTAVCALNVFYGLLIVSFLLESSRIMVVMIGVVEVYVVEAVDATLVLWG